MRVIIPDPILRKAGRLTREERCIMQTHVNIGASMLAGGSSALVRTAELIARSHHERWDGGGYPDQVSGFRGDATPCSPSDIERTP